MEELQQEGETDSYSSNFDQSDSNSDDEESKKKVVS